MSLVISDISYAYQKKEVLHQLALHVEDGEVLSLLGPNGSGKTTLLKCIANIQSPSTGVITMGDTKLHQLSKKELAKHMAYVPQDTSSMFPMSVMNAVLLGRTPYIRFGARSQDVQIAIHAMGFMGLQDLAFHKINELSGGERQRVFIARALAQEPRVLLLDEPTSNLDLKHQLESLAMIRRIAKEQNLMVIMAIHDLNLAARFSDTIIMMKSGHILAQGVPAKVLNPQNIRNTYDVEAVVKMEKEFPFVMPLKAIE